MPKRSFAIVTATADPAQSVDCRLSWVRHARGNPTIYQVINGAAPPYVGPTGAWASDGRYDQVYTAPTFLGVVPAFAVGVAKALADGVEIIACLHDDLEITEPQWDEKVTDLFRACPRAGLLGFGGARGLADADIYQTPYRPMQLVRKDFLSNMRHAEAHGRRVELAQPVACLDGFSQVGLREYWQGYAHATAAPVVECPTCHAKGFAPSALEGRCGFCDGQENGETFDHVKNLFDLMARWGIVHHAYDAALGCFAKRLGYQTWLLPITCHHFGGRTAVGSPAYHAWADGEAARRDREAGTTTPGVGDQVFWQQAHQIVYDHFTDVLPMRVEAGL